jgi:3-oxoacyl-[acyl-carrier protein] reductase
VNNVVVTGAGRGLGFAIAERLVRDGYNVIGVGRTLSRDYRELIDRADAGVVSFHEYDLQDLAGIPEFIAGIAKKSGTIFGLVNNAGIGLDGVLATMHVRDIGAVLRVNLEAPIILAKFVSRYMLLQGSGRIVNVSSIIATTGFNGLSVYGASKAGLLGFTRSLARELGRANITVNCISPGFMETDMTAGLEGEKLKSILRRSPLGLPSPKDAAAAVAYLLSDDAAHITGTTITVDGGSTA